MKAASPPVPKLQDSITPLGFPVEVGQVDKELKKLWEQNEGAMTRASLMNLAIYSEEPGSLEKNTALTAELTENHACRAIVVGADRAAKETRVEAWVNAHCHVSRAGSKQMCSEQLSFRLSGNFGSLLPNLVLAHLDSDLPFCLWRQGDLRDPMNPQLWSWVDRLIYDSHEWKDFNQQFRHVETAEKEANDRIVLCDLNWTRLDKVRYAIAQFFDHPAAHHHFAEIESVSIDFASGYRSTAVLLAAWLGAQLNWQAEKGGGADQIRFVDSNRRSISIDLHQKGEHPIGEIVIKSGPTTFIVRPAACGDLLEVLRTGGHEKGAPQMMPAQSNDLVSLIGQELMRGGPHRVYLHAVNSIRDYL